MDRYGIVGSVVGYRPLAAFGTRARLAYAAILTIVQGL